MRFRRAKIEKLNPAGLSLSWRLGLATALIVSTVLAGLVLAQQAQQLRRAQRDREALLDAFLRPLVEALATVGSQSEARERLLDFQFACLRHGHPEIRLELRDSEDRSVASSVPPQWRSRPDPAARRETLPVFSPLLPGGAGTLEIWQDEPTLAAVVGQRWRGWLLDLGLLIAVLLGALLVIHHFLLIRPLGRLLQGVRRSARGYPGALELQGGPWEWRWLAEQLSQQGRQLEETVSQLVEAERRAHQLGASSAPQMAPAPLGDPAERDPARRTLRRRVAHQLLLEKCRLLERGDPGDTEVRRLARGVWEQDLIEAERLGEIELRSRLDNAALRVLRPREWDRLGRAVAATREADERWLLDRARDLAEALQVAGVPAQALQRRSKHLAGLWRKMAHENLRLREVPDRFGLRVVVPEEADCYRALAVVHGLWQPLPLRFRDYIIRPKDNGYQSLHTCLRVPDGRTLEVQIRSQDMHRRADGGSAAHWRYRADQLEEFEEDQHPPLQ